MQLTLIAALASLGFAVAPSPAQPASPLDKSTPAAMIDGQRLEWSDLIPGLAEAAGGVILEEAILSRLLEARAAQAGITIDAAAIDAERERLGRTLALTAGVPVEESSLLIDRVRAARGLGDSRFPATLRRNAMLRAMVRTGKFGESAPEVSDDDLKQAYALKHGPLVRARLILVRTSLEADAAMTRLRGRPDASLPGEPFGEVAADVSIDPSGPRGGLLDPFSLDDIDYPVAVRRVLAQKKPGDISEPIAVSWGESAASGPLGSEGFAIVKLEENIPPAPDAPSLEAATPALRDEVTMVRERAAMDRLARRLLAEARITIFDRTLDKSWKQHTGE